MVGTGVAVGKGMMVGAGVVVCDAGVGGAGGGAGVEVGWARAVDTVMGVIVETMMAVGTGLGVAVGTGVAVAIGVLVGVWVGIDVGVATGAASVTVGLDTVAKSVGSFLTGVTGSGPVQATPKRTASVS